MRLFSDLIQPRGAAVIDVDHEHADAVLAAAKQRRLRLLTVGGVARAFGWSRRPSTASRRP